MTKSWYNFTTLSLIIMLFMSHYAEAYDNKTTHRKLSEETVPKSTINIYLKNNLDFHNGYAELIHGKGIVKWLSDGSDYEDEPMCRASNHFHNPRMPWNQSYLTDDTTVKATIIKNFCNSTGWLLTARKSAITWATGYIELPPNGKKASFSSAIGYESHNWDRARHYYYKALVSSGDRKGFYEYSRPYFWVETFKSVGHVMHLLQDMAVPAHVRNDFQSHLIDNENKNQLNPLTWYKQPYEYYVQYNSSQIASSTPVFPTFTDTKLTDFWDTDKYNGSNPSTQTDIGLAEFSNANYFSDFTIYPNNATTPEHTFPYPYIKESGIQGGYKICSDISVGSDFNPLYPFRKYISRKSKGGSCPLGTPKPTEIGKADHFAVVSLLEENNPYAVPISSLKVVLDNNVHNTYAKELLPRAVGYSASLLDYFFRGDIRLDYETGAAPGYMFLNKTKERFDGSFQVYYDNINDERHILWDGTGYLEAKMNDKTNTISLPHPVDAKEPGKYILVSKGKLGNEKEAVAGYINSRILEITPPEQYIYAKLTADDPTPGFTLLKAKVRNTTKEAMLNGTLQAVAKYKKTTEDEKFKYAVSAPVPVASLSTVAQEYSFDFTNSPIPTDATDLYLEVIFKGTIDKETDATAIGVKDLGEPTPIEVFNNTDRTCIKGTWYATTSPETAAMVDSLGNKNGRADETDINLHVVKNIYIKISSPARPIDASSTQYNFRIAALDIAEFKRAGYILSEKEFSYSHNVEWWPRDQKADQWMHFIMTYMNAGKTVTGQTEYTSEAAICGNGKVCTYYEPPGYYNFRDYPMWGYGGMVFVNRPYPADSKCEGVR